MESDAELLRRYCEAGDARAMDRLVDRHQAAVYAFVRRFLGDSPGVEDVVQEVWLRVLRAGRGFDGRSRFTTWLFTIARNLSYDHLRRLRREVRDGEATEATLRDLEAPGAAVPDRVARRELGRLVEEAVAALPEAQREVFLLREQTDLTFEEIARAQGVPRETVKSRMRYALEAIRRRVAPATGEEDATRGL